jgi:hypothetical protein
MEKDADCGESENHRENYTAVSVAAFGRSISGSVSAL